VQLRSKHGLHKPDNNRYPAAHDVQSPMAPHPTQPAVGTIAPPQHLLRHMWLAHLVSELHTAPAALSSTKEKVALKFPAAALPVHVTFADVAHVASDTGTLPEVAEISCIVNRNGFSDTMTQTCITVPGAGTYVAVKELLFTTSISEKVSDWPAPAAVYVCPPTVTVPPICVVVQLSALIVVFICQEVVTPPGMHTGAGLPASVPAAVDRTTASARRIASFCKGSVDSCTSEYT
jgi:hypothetical protein